MICLSRWCFMASDGADKDKTYPVEMEYTWNRQIIRKTTNMFAKITD